MFVIPHADFVCLVTFAGWLELWMVWAEGSGALHLVGALAGQLKLK